jgi:RHS repeat-associated protein
VNDYVIRSGDRIYLRQENYASARAGIVLKFTNGTSTLNNTYDQSGYALNCDQYVASWHLRYADLSAHEGKKVQDVQLVNDACSPAGAFWATFTDIAIASTDGAVRPIYNRQKAMTLSVSCDSGVTDCWQIIGHPTNVGWATFSTTTYYHGDHLGSSRFLSSYNGTPMWEATYLPYGQEWNAPTSPSPLSPNHYKFTGQERDGESGLDYFGARYYASALGRFTSPDPENFGARLVQPQGWNAYTYALNNPLKMVDRDGRAPDIAIIENGPTRGNPFGHTGIAVTGYGVFSFGNGTQLGSSLAEYVTREAPRRDTTITIIKTTPEQDKAAVEALLKQDEKGGVQDYPDNCARRANAGLDAAGVPAAPEVALPSEAPVMVPADTGMPGTAGKRAGVAQAQGQQVETVKIPKGSTTVPQQLQQFEPTTPSKDPRLPKPENTQSPGRP